MKQSLLRAVVLAIGITLAGAASADDNQDRTNFVRSAQTRISAAAGDDAKVNAILNEMVDYDILTARAFREHWGPEREGVVVLTAEQKREISKVFAQVVQKNHRRNVNKTKNYAVNYIGATELAAGEGKVKTEAKSTVKANEPPFRVDYIVKNTSSGLRVVDIITEGNHLTNSYYEQFHKILTTPGQGYAHILKKLNERLAKPE